MRKYEIGLLFDAGLDKKKLEKVLKEFEDFIKKNKGQIIEKKQWEERKLAYPIKKADTGIYFFAHYELETDKNDALLKDLNLNHDILRYLITLPPEDTKLESKPQEVKRQKEKGKSGKAEGKGDRGKVIGERKIKKEVKKEPVKVEKKEEKKVEKKIEKKEPVEKVVEKKPAYAKASAGKKEEEKPRVKKTVEESKKAKAQEQKEKKVSEEKLDQEIDRILSDEDLL